MRLRGGSRFVNPFGFANQKVKYHSMIVCCAYFNIEKQTFYLSFDTLATVLATFTQIGQFLQASGHSDKDSNNGTLKMSPLDGSVRQGYVFLTFIWKIFYN